MADELKTYEGENQRVSFVARCEKNPNFHKSDRRFFTTRPLFRYCEGRLREFWKLQGVKKPHTAPQSFTFEGEPGWWFPTSWVEEFARSPASDVIGEKPRMIPRAVTRLDVGGAFPKQSELHYWRLPAGTIVVAADARVRYPDGTFETWGEIRRRHKGYVDQAYHSEDAKRAYALEAASAVLADEIERAA